MTYKCWLPLLCLLLPSGTGVRAQTYSASGNRIQESVFREARVSATDEVPIDTEFLARLKSSSIAGNSPPLDVMSDLAMASNEVYRKDHETVAYFVRGLGFDRFFSITNDWQNLAVYVMVSPAVTLVVFRGTDENLDWLTNLNLFSKETARGVFHLGFFDAYGAVRTDVRKLIGEHARERLWITGHSLGGAMALLCGFDEKLHGTNSPDVITFGQPRVADANGCRSIDAALKDHFVRVARPTDIVARVPPKLPFFPAYGHAGLRISLGNNGLEIGPSVMQLRSESTMVSDGFGNICMEQRVYPTYGSVFDEAPITLEELQSIPSRFAPRDPPCEDGTPASFGVGTVAWAAFKYAIQRALAWIVEQHSMDEYLRLLRSYRA